MKQLGLAIISLVALVLPAVPATAHFQMVYTPQSSLARGGKIDLKLVFTHPFDAGHTMAMGQPERFFALHKGEIQDLLPALQPLNWKSLTNTGPGYGASVQLKGLGDWVFCLQPAPYLEEAEMVYIQQFTKTIVNVGGLPTDWNSEVGLPAEIVPLNMPYAMLAGNVFRGIVKRNGQPVPFAEIEVEYMNHTPLMEENAFAEQENASFPATFTWPTMIIANAQGEFAYGLPQAGWWGFCALGAGPVTEFNGKELSQDAVIWVQSGEIDERRPD